jgi:hypothetical protein
LIHAIRPPLQLKSGKNVFPKLLFAYSEEALKFLLYHQIEKSGIKVHLEPKIPYVKEKLIFYEGPYPQYEFKSRASHLEPDILCEGRRVLIECENFFKVGINEIVKHAHGYEKALGLRSFAAVWKAEAITQQLRFSYGGWERVGDRVVQVNPATGVIDASPLFYEEGPKPPEGINFEYALPGSPEFHTRMEYELGVWLWGRGEQVAFEIPISSGGKVYGPDKLVVSEAKGFVEWEPRGWSPYQLDLRPPDVKVDVVSYSPEDGTLRGYEIKSRRDLASGGDRVVSRTLREPLIMLRSGLFNEVYIVLPVTEAETMAESLGGSSDDEDRALGVLALTSPYSFKVIKPAKPRRPEKSSSLTVTLSS